jgi:hypothetical protein
MGKIFQKTTKIKDCPGAVFMFKSVKKLDGNSKCYRITTKILNLKIQQ